MNDKELKAILDRCTATTPGPWKSWIEGRDHESGDSFIMTGISDGEDIFSEQRGEDIYLSGATKQDQDFIAHAKQDIPKLIAEIRRLRKIHKIST